MSRFEKSRSARQPAERVEDWYEKVYFVLTMLGVRIPSLPWWVPNADFRRQGFLMPIALTALAFATLMVGDWVLGPK